MEFRDNRIRDVTFTFTAGPGPSFTNNTFTGSSIFAAQVDTLTISGNRFAEADTAVFLDVSFGDVITGNRFVGNRVGLQTFEAWGAVVTDNVFANNEGVGAIIGGPTGRPYTITGNTFRDNGASGLYLGDRDAYATGSVSNNRFIGNGFRPGSWTDRAGRPLTAGAVIAPVGSYSDITVARNRAIRNAGLGIAAENVADGGGNRARANGDPAQCLGVVCT